MEARILVVYYSRTGRTRAVGEGLAQALGCEMEEIVEPRGRTGIFGSLRSAVEAWRERPSAIAAPKRDPSSYDLVVIGTPVWAWAVSSPVRAYLTAMKPRLPDVAFFCSLGATGSTRAFDQMRNLVGKAPRAECVATQREVASGAYRERFAAFAKALEPVPVECTGTPQSLC